MGGMVLVRLDEGHGPMAYIPAPIPLDGNGHAWDASAAEWCLMCGASADRGGRCPEADEVEFENAELASYAALYAVPAPPCYPSV